MENMKELPPSPSTVSQALSSVHVITECSLRSGAEKGQVLRKLIVALVVSTCFMLFQFVGGYISGSIAIMTDAVHELSDAANYAIAIYATVLSSKPAPVEYSFGYHRAETIGALINAVSICVLALTLVIQAIERLVLPEPINGKLMFIFSIIGLVVNSVLLLSLGHDHGHGHGHDHGHEHVQDHGHKHEHSHDHGHHSEGRNIRGSGHAKSSARKASNRRKQKLSVPDLSQMLPGNAVAEAASQSEAATTGSIRLDGASIVDTRSNVELVDATVPEVATECTARAVAEAQVNKSEALESYMIVDSLSVSDHPDNPEDPLSTPSSFLTSQHSAVPAPVLYGERPSEVVETTHVTSGDPHAQMSVLHNPVFMDKQEEAVHQQKYEESAYPALYSPEPAIHHSRPELQPPRRGVYFVDGADTSSHSVEGHNCCAVQVVPNTGGDEGSDVGSIHDSSTGPSGTNNPPPANAEANNRSLQGIVLHIIADISQSLALSIAGLILWWKDGNPNWLWVDSFCTFLFAIYVVYMSRTLLLESIWELMEATPKILNVRQLTGRVEELEGVSKFHDVHVWSVSPDMVMMMANCDIDVDAERSWIQLEIQMIAHELGIRHSKVQFSEVSYSEGRNR